MAGQRDQVLDAGLRLVAEGGVASLTHDAVDSAAGVAPGVTRRLFVSHGALVGGVVQRCIEREQAMASGPPVEPTPAGLADTLGRFVRRAVGEDRVVTLARYALQAEVARIPSLRPSYGEGAGSVNAWGVDLVCRAGSRHAERDYEILANYVTGLVFHELALPAPGPDATARIRRLIDALGRAA